MFFPPSSFGCDMKQYCTIRKLKNVESIRKKIGGKCVQVWTGFKRSVQDGGDEEVM